MGIRAMRFSRVDSLKKRMPSFGFIFILLSLALFALFAFWISHDGWY
jgi:hypothetical protein